MKLVKDKQTIVDIWAGMPCRRRLELTTQEIIILKKAMEICSKADDKVKQDIDDTTDFGLAEMYLSEILEEVESKAGYQL